MPLNTVRDAIQIYIEEIKATVGGALKGDHSHGLLITAGIEDARVLNKQEKQDVVGNAPTKLVRTIDCKIWGQPKNVEDLLYDMCQSDKNFQIVLLAAANRVATDMANRANGISKGGIILPDNDIIQQ